jgi:hypothetical protein
MTKSLLFFSLLSFLNIIYAQEHLFKIDLDNSEEIVFDSYLIKPNENNFYNFLKYKKSVIAYILDKEGQVLNKIISNDFKKKYIHFIGHNINKDEVAVFLKNANGKKLLSIVYDFQNQQTQQYEYELGMDENFVQSFSYKDDFYVFTFDNTLNLIKLSSKAEPERTLISPNIDFSNLRIKQRDFRTYFDFDLLKLTHKNYPNVNNKLSNNIRLTSRKNKVYNQNDKLVWTFDKFEDHTLVLEVNFQDFKVSTKIVPKPVIDEKIKTSNSYLFQDRIVQIVISTKQVKIQIKDLPGEKILNEYIITSDSDLPNRKNSFEELEISDTCSDTKKYDKLSKFVRKITKDNVGISVYPFQSNYKIAFGSIEALPNNSVTNSNLGFGIVANPENPTLEINPNLYKNHYAFTTTVHKYTFYTNENFEQVENKTYEDILFKLNRFKNNYGNISAERIFKIGDNLIFGFNNLGIGEYKYVSF